MPHGLGSLEIFASVGPVAKDHAATLAKSEWEQIKRGHAFTLALSDHTRERPTHVDAAVATSMRAAQPGRLTPPTAQQAGG
ncbi:hypothetical protein P8C59_000628 [Phyllachora maydis]|uniref:Uncharacterized protein n=1 Tax=Phyllachora maydis TaxID=1825666 RepID=A0AAD9HY26_9PEZI|nr:hypothetical protein P8C59_000628 [Phyllachora maydis]